MNAASVLILILVLSFAADRLVKGLLFLLSLVPAWSRWFPDPRLVLERPRQIIATDRLKIAYVLLIALIAGAAVFLYDDLRIVRLLVGPQIPDVVDIAVTMLVVMGGSDLVSRILQLSGVGDVGVGGAPAGGRNQPVEITGRLVLDSSGRLDDGATPPGGG